MSTPTYIAIHQALKVKRGRAATYPCDHCGRQAEHWAYDYSDPNPVRVVGPRTGGEFYSLDLSRYMPLCRSCHGYFDARQAGRSQCGTDSGYYRHRRRGEKPCDDCKAGHRQATYDRLGVVRKRRVFRTANGGAE